MKHWQEELIHAMYSVSSEAELLALGCKMSSEMGFEFCAYGVRIVAYDMSAKIITLNNYSEKWKRIYSEKNHLATDPTVAHAYQSTLPLIWTDEVFKNNHELLEDANAEGLNVGIAQPIHGPNNTVGLLTLARSGNHITEKEMLEIGPKLLWAAHTTHAGLIKLIADQSGEKGIRLTDREVEVLKWMAEGKTAAEVSDILHLSERTVIFHSNNAIKKLNAPNRTAAVVRAALLGLI